MTGNAAGPVRRREIVAWAFFDFANSSYTTVIVTVAFSVFFTRVVAPGHGDGLWSLGIFLSNALVVLAAPLVGALADGAGRKKKFLFVSYVVCVGGTAALALVGPGDVVPGLVLFVVSNVAFSLGENLCAAFLPEISTPETIGRISGFGWGLGYFGGLASLVAVAPLLAGGFSAANLGHLRLAWLVTAAFFLVAGAPTFVVLAERAPRGPQGTLTRHLHDGLARLGVTVRSARQFLDLRRFLVAFFLYSGGLATVIAFAAIYAERTLAFGPVELIRLFVVIQLSSAAGALGFGFVQDKIGALATVRVTLVLWIGVCVAAFACATKGQFWVIALVAGLGIGSLQSASRSIVGLFSPHAKEAEFFGLWGLAGKAAAAVGPAAFGLVSVLTGSQRLAIGSAALFFIAGWLSLGTVSEARGRAAAVAWNDEK